jgi:hypothetical protein
VQWKPIKINSIPQNKKNERGNKMKYTIDTLKGINASYNSEHRITQSDVDKANLYVEIIEGSRSDKKVQAGDIVEFTNKHGDYYGNAHIENLNENEKWCICEHPYVPFIGLTDDNKNIYCNTSGGAWDSIPKELKYIGKRLKWFCDWGHWGACANGAIHFQALVNVWEYIENNPLYGDYTTKNYNKNYVSYCVDDKGNPKNDSCYRYFADGIAFKTTEDYKAWIKTYKAAEFKGHWENQTVVFCYKEQEYLLNKNEWDALDLPKDTRLCNGVNLCKVDYDDKNHLIKTYRYSNSGDLDWRKFKEYELARGNYNL